MWDGCRVTVKYLFSGRDHRIEITAMVAQSPFQAWVWWNDDADHFNGESRLRDKAD